MSMIDGLERPVPVPFDWAKPFWNAANEKKLVVQHCGPCDLIKDSRIKGFRGAQPINFAIITLDEDPGLNFLSNLPGTPAGEVPVGAAVEVIFDESVEVGRQLVPEWRVIG